MQDARPAPVAPRKGVLAIATQPTSAPLALAPVGLSQAKELFPNLAEFSPIGMAVCDADGRISWANPALFELLGYEPDALVGRHASEITHADDLTPDQVLRMPHLVDDQGQYEVEVRLIHRNGHAIRALVRGTVLRDHRHRPVGAIAQVLDITERTRRQERQIREHEERFRNVFENAGIGMAIGALDGSFQRVNRSMTRITGYETHELLSMSVLDITHPDDIEASRELMARIFDGETETCAMEKRYLRKDGKTVWAEVHVSAVRDAEGRLQCTLAQIQDITERQQAREKRAQTERYLQDLSETLPAIVFVFDLVERRPLYVNRRGLDHLGQTREALYEMGAGGVERLVHPEDIKQTEHDLARMMHLADGEVLELQLRLRHASGHWLWMQSRSAVLRRAQDGTAEAIVGTVEDITERRGLEEQLRQSQKMEAIGRLAGGIAHDFNNLLTVILGYAESLRAGLEPNTPVRGDADRIVKAGHRAAALTQQLLAFGRRQVMQPAFLDLNAVLNDVESLLGRLIGEDIRLTFFRDPEIGTVKADPAQIEQVLLNLAVNARDAMPLGGKLSISTIDARLDKTDVREFEGLSPGHYVRLRVHDDGEGMSEDTRARIFEPFFTTKPREKGTGLGLSMVYGIVKQSGGNIYVQSEPGVGTTFDLFLPCVTRADEHPDASERKATAIHGIETILLVEDEDAVRRLAREGLERKGYHMLEAANAREALELAEGFTRPIHLVVTDLIMPGMNGRELASLLARLHPESRVLYVSGYTDDSPFRQGGLERGREYMQKPFTPAELARRVRETLDATGGGQA